MTKDQLKKFIVELNKENKKLEGEVKDLVERNIELDKKYMFVLEENRKLKEENEELEEYKWMYEGLG